MNKPIRTISIFCLLLFLALMLNATYLQYWKSGKLNDDPRNRRVLVASYARERGAILVGRTSVAQSVESDDEYKFQRTYPKPLVYAPITGWFSYFGQTGVERSQNDVLSGDDSRLFVTKLVDLLSNNPTKGGNVQLTIDPDAQQAAYDGLKALGPSVQGSVVALQPSTGKVLAMVSLPTYDPNKLASHDLSAASDTYDRLDKDPAQPLLNRGIQTRLPPGSTFKVVTAAAAIEKGLYTASDTVPGGVTYQLPLTRDDSGLIDNEGRSCGANGTRIPFSQAMEQSCNTTFAALAGEVGAEDMAKTAEGFGFNQHYFDDISPQAVSVFPTDINTAELGQTGFGQFEVAATPLQMAMVAAGLANGGTVMKPYLVDEQQDADLDVVDKTDPEELSQAVSATTASEVTKLMVDTVNEGTASPGAIPGISVAGKTGTAQSGIDDVPPYAWYISFAPADNPEVAVAVMIQKADIPRGEIAGGVYGGPIAKAVMEAVVK
ncbi:MULTISPECIES: peptidoglycan D,D-transpeptidase FtsI family protein [unclassified Nocardioides]|uniref:peptidoglycan D,D-transpeptidase FtsI family protein n=1 Tax=unclassified Nocardioides TaxID=2615069 RepID=UPI0009F0353D|nr:MULTISPECIES: penicillin-binding protein 2 [unclassified Nocardioides]GAW47904.1 peptidoglycan glycosyltransferase [Nocardioides sp. PD653-B2]GAW53793.1 peptidoglycan glycosyltransferase [Nocardioides sp. PD653]